MLNRWFKLDTNPQNAEESNVKQLTEEEKAELASEFLKEDPYWKK